MFLRAQERRTSSVLPWSARDATFWFKATWGFAPDCLGRCGIHHLLLKFVLIFSYRLAALVVLRCHPIETRQFLCKMEQVVDPPCSLVFSAEDDIAGNVEALPHSQEDEVFQDALSEDDNAEHEDDTGVPERPVASPQLTEPWRMPPPCVRPAQLAQPWRMPVHGGAGGDDDNVDRLDSSDEEVGEVPKCRGCRQCECAGCIPQKQKKMKTTSAMTTTFQPADTCFTKLAKQRIKEEVKRWSDETTEALV